MLINRADAGNDASKLQALIASINAKNMHYSRKNQYFYNNFC